MNGSTERAITPWHLWVIGGISLLWNGFGALDYVMTQTANEAYMSGFTPEQLEYFYGFPTWSVALWATAIWTSVLGSVLLLLRSKYAMHAFAVSLVTMVANAGYSYGLSNGLEVMGAFGAVFTLVIFIIALALFLYAKQMAGKGVLQ